MLASFIMCQACGCKGRAGNTLSQHDSESPVFRYQGHDPFEGIMIYSCANCQATLVVDPMEMLTSFCVQGVPESVTSNRGKNPEARSNLETRKNLQKMSRKTAASKYH